MSQEHIKFRSDVDHFMQHHPQSPLSSEQREDFTGLNYYETAAEWIIVAPVDCYPESELHIEIETSTGEMRHYRRWAKVSFEIAGNTAELTIYSDPWGESLFLPFKDATNGKETYGAGRYLDNHRPGLSIRGGQAIIDFNHAYNPYCAYSPSFSCPLPPRENWLKHPIEAGEKSFSQ